MFAAQLTANTAKIQPPFNYWRLCVREKPCCDATLRKYSRPVQFFCAAMKHIAIKATNAPLLVGITGASGVIYGVRLLELLRACNIETHLIVSRAAQMTLAYETKLKLADVTQLATVVHSNNDVGAACSSGSFRTRGMVIAPCSIKTMAEIATGNTANLISRAGDVVLKERRRLVLMLRETPLHIGHIRNMATVTEAGAIVYPPVPAFYALPNSIDEMVDHTLARVLELFDIDVGKVHRWTGERERPKTREPVDRS
jgi:4-hydroxy-3-polyprenylbenzoate decarboxylase